MNAQELRIGNQIYYNQINLDTGERERVVVTVDANMIKAMTMHDEELYSPIELQPEILEQCGFKKHGLYDMWVSYKLEFVGNYDCSIVSLSVDGSKSDVSVKYLHQLQNLYFSLTNTELQWNRKQ